MLDLPLAFALVGQTCRDAPDSSPCRVVEGIGVMTEGSTSLKLAGDPAYPGATIGVGWTRQLVHESGEAMEYPDAIGRPISACMEHQSPIVVIGGAAPSDFAMALALERSIARPRRGRPATLDEALVDVGLASDLVATRDAAHRMLRGRGLAAAGALLAGLGSRDAEVRHRCGMILEEIRTGVWEGVEP